MNAKKIVGVIGCGYWGTNIIKTLIELKVSNIYCYDIDSQNLKKSKKRFNNVTICKNFSKIINNSKIKLVFLCVPTSKIVKIAKILISNKKNVFLEKPISSNQNEVKELIYLSKKNKVRVMCGYVYIFSKYINYIKKILEKKILGEIKYVETNRKNFGPIRKNDSSLWDLSSHDIAIIKYLFSGKIINQKYLRTNVTKGNTYDVYSINFKIKKTNFNINTSWLYPEKIRQILIIGTKKILFFDELNIKETIKIYKTNHKYPKAAILTESNFNPQTNIQIQKPIVKKFNTYSPLRDELNYCLKNIFKKNKIITDGNFGLTVIKELKKFT